MPDSLHTGPTPGLPLPRAQLEDWFSDRLTTTGVRIVLARLLAGGAVQHNWRIDVDTGRETHAFVLRAGPNPGLPESLPKAAEFAFLTRAHATGIPVPEPLWVADADVPFFVTAFVTGDARRASLIARSDNSALIQDLASALARIHEIHPGEDAACNTPGSRVATLVQWFDGIGPLPTEIANGLGTGLRWLRAHAPADTGARLVHRDFRTGNFLVADGRLTAVLDWEFAGWGDPAEDFGWFCAACWRGDARGRAAGGLGARESFHEAYTAAGGTVPDRERVRFWEVFAHLRWTLIALQQGARARAGAYPAWELEEAATRVPGLLDGVARMVRA